MKSFQKALFCSVVVAGIVFQSQVQANTPAEIEGFLQRFHENPIETMDQNPPKVSAVGTEELPRSLFPDADIQSGRFVQLKDLLRRGQCTMKNGARICLSDVEPGRAPFADDDLAATLAGDTKILKSLAKMDEKGLISGQVKVAPWSDDYWPLFSGTIAARYADRDYPGRKRTKDWKVFRDYIESNAVHESSVDLLSPAEKYDLLVGDANWSLTRASWAEGEQYYTNQGAVEEWMGICNGWAAAAYRIARPTAVTTVLAVDGVTKIRFFPSDIKALASMLWAKVYVPTLFAGGRCDDQKPKRDKTSGRVLSDECFDTNPGTWHLAAVNMMGARGVSFVIDATYDYEVWNQPVYGYQYTYFNPQTLKATSTLKSAMVPIEKFSRDKFAKFRADKAKFVVGVSMELTYVVETRPTHAMADAPERDAHKTVRYTYDLELDGRGSIIGGEWYNKAHPDFLWTPEPSFKALSAGDRYLRGAWDASEAFPVAWTKVAAKTSKGGQPLAAVVDALVLAARLAP